MSAPHPTDAAHPTDTAHPARRAVFLDRDGTLIVERHYLSDPDQVMLEHGVAAGLAALSAAGFALIVLSNQSGIGRGRLTAEQALSVNRRLEELLEPHGVRMAGWYLCPHAPDAGCECRKPRPGLALRAAQDLGLDLHGSFMIGDKRSDLELADAIGATGLLLRTGQGLESLDWARTRARLAFDDFSQAAVHICTRLHGSPSP